MTIGIFDSGVGGLGIFDEIRKLIPNKQILYLADTKNCPYGDKTERQIKQICLDNSRFLIEKGADIIVVACNTGSTIALEFIRSELKKIANNNHIPLRKWNMVDQCQIPIVGVVPVVKTCSEISKNKKIGILATRRTVESQYLRDLVEKFCPSEQGFKVYYQAANPLVELVENYKLQIIDYKLNHKSKIINLKFMSKDLKLLEKYLQTFKNNNVDTISLGCTHFPFLRQQIEQIMGPNVRILDSNGAVARQVHRIVTSNKVTRKTRIQNTEYRFYTTGDPEKLKIQIKNLINLEPEKVENVII